MSLAPHPHRARRVVLAAALIASLLASGCARRPEPLEPQVLPSPPGGAVHALEVLQREGKREVVALSWRGVARWDEGSWRQLPVQLKLGDRTIETMRPFDQEHAAAQRFIAFGERLWWLTHHDLTRAPVLFTSVDGQRWTRAPLPERYDRPLQPRRDADEVHISHTPISSTAALRLVRAANALYLVDERKLWVMVGPAPGGDLIQWRPVSLEGTALEQPGAHPDSLPAIIQHYLPAAPARPFELLTVYREQLRVYRRLEGQTLWALVHTLPTVDRHLAPLPGTDEVYVLGASTLYRATDQAERWEQLRATPARAHENYTSMVLIPPMATVSASPMTTLVLGTDRGALLHSADGGQRWTVTREADPDGRGVTDMRREGATVWASTWGRGVWRSQDQGLTWASAQDGLAAATPEALALGADGQLALGADAGWFTWDEAAQRWQAHAPRAVSTLRRVQSRWLLGTRSGALVRSDDLDSAPVELGALGEGHRSPGFSPQSDAALGLSPHALLTITGGAGAPWRALSRGRGWLESRDGQTWRPRAMHPALTEALSGTTITGLAALPPETLLLSTRNLHGATTTGALWRSDDGGALWRSVERITDDDDGAGETPRLEQTEDGRLWLLGTRGALVSSDGDQWTSLHGPWQAHHVVSLTASGDTGALLVRTDQTHELFLVHDLRASAPARIERFTLRWPDALQTTTPTIRQLLLRDRQLVLRTDRHVLRVSLPDTSADLTNTLSVLVATLIIILFCAVAFFVLWRTS